MNKLERLVNTSSSLGVVTPKKSRYVSLAKLTIFLSKIFSETLTIKLIKEERSELVKFGWTFFNA